MDKCACKGIRKCALCEHEKGSGDAVPAVKKFLLCAKCNRCRSISDETMDMLLAADCNGECTLELIDGVFLKENFLTEDEENLLMDHINRTNWVESQSGRFKQDFGPKVNFKKKKLKTDQFIGLPSYSRFLVERLQSLREFEDFVPVELCNLKYLKERGASIDPHVDDVWVWGPRLVTFNLMSHTMLTMTPSADLLATGLVDNCEILIPLRRYSLVCLSHDARYKWLHSIKRGHILNVRVAITLRELSSTFKTSLPECETGWLVEQIASSYNG
jgi:alkylated DNA repair protein alkB family protein 4